MAIKASIIIPTRNEAGNIAPLLRGIAQVMQQNGLIWEAIIVDDQSQDLTPEIARQYSHRYPLRVIERTRPPSLARSVLEGLAAAQGEVCVVMDADLSHPMESIPELVWPVLKGEVEAVVGSRYCPGGNCVGWSHWRHALSKLAGLLARPCIALSDPTSGFMAVRREAISALEFRPLGWKIVLEILVRSGVSFKEVPIIFGKRHSGKSKLKLIVIVQYLLQLSRLYLWKVQLHLLSTAAAEKRRGKVPAAERQNEEPRAKKFH